ncbi:alpha/beta hydrolase [Roseibium sp. MMSF_3544]|uniref:alpha/beta hydrolase n=1 Tax=unclassified Roseibium TaxID=2629323 RepID=UPI00273FD26C|nr:alpha/beta fold hydrolase [Roseibium sp. MMSF_3544]
MADAETGRAGTTEHKSSGFWAKSGRWLVKLAVIVAIAYGMAAGFMYLNQRNFVFVPTGELMTPEERGLENVSVELVEMADGTRITAWAADPSIEGAPTVLYFHGNSSNLSNRSERFRQILDSGYGLYAPTHRGYAGSEGSPSEAALISDALEVYDTLSASGAPVIVHGESLGTGIATAVAAVRPDVGLLVLEAPYTALVDMAAEQYPWLPVNLLMKDPMKTRDRIASVEAPVLVIHGTEDRVIPVEHGRKLFEIAPEPKELLILEGAGHGDLWKRGLWNSVQENWAEIQP